MPLDLHAHVANGLSEGLVTAIAAQALTGQQRIAVAYSGGLDSSALLLAATQAWPNRVMAFHVNHGLQAAAALFEAHCQGVCQQWNVPLHVAQTQVQVAKGQSTEEAARTQRYAALAQLAKTHNADLVLLAQHADDQLETVLLALSRGAGLPGLAAMPSQFVRYGVAFARPWLAVSRPEIEAWWQVRANALAANGSSANGQALTYMTDPTNADTRYTRNRIRAGVLPALLSALPQARDTFARSATHAAQAQTLLTEFAEADLACVGTPPRIAALQALSPARLANVLRHWLRTVHGTQASAVQLAELQKQIAACTTRGHRIDLVVGTGKVKRAALGATRQDDCLDWTIS